MTRITVHESRSKATKNLKSWEPGTSGNPQGRPKKGESWAEIIRAIADMTGPEAAQHYACLGRALRPLPASATLKELVVIRVFVSLINDPSPGLLKEVMDRTDGKVSEVTQATNTLNIMGYREMLEKVYGSDKVIRVVEHGKPEDQEPATDAG